VSEKTQNAIFARDVQRRTDELIDWILDHSPDQQRQLSREDFRDVRQALFSIAVGDSTLQHIEPEPEEGGAQYINDNPAPWP
jgi:hypothetical protein